MTEFNNINQYKGFIPNTPKTETRIILEVKEQSKLTQIASYLGIKTAECSGISDDDAKKLGTAANAAALVVTSAICPPFGAAAIAAEGAIGTGMKVFGDDEEVKKAGEVLSNSSTVGGLATGGANVVAEKVGDKMIEDVGTKVAKENVGIIGEAIKTQ